MPKPTRERNRGEASETGSVAFGRAISSLLRTRTRKVTAAVAGGFLAAVGTYLGNQFLSVAEKPFSRDVLTARVITEAGASSHVYAPYFVVTDAKVKPGQLTKAQIERVVDRRLPLDEGSVAGSPQVIRLELRGSTDDTVVIHSITARVIRRAAPIAGWFVANPGCGSAPVRLAMVDLDRANPKVDYVDPAGDAVQNLALRVDRKDIEILEIWASTTESYVEWLLDVSYTTSQGSGTLQISNDGHPFAVTSERRSEGYAREFAAAGQSSLRREPGWDDGIDAC